MKRIGRVVAIAVVVLVAAAGALWVVVPANESPEDGPADPIAETRRWVLGVLRGVGLVDDAGFTVGAAETGTNGPDGAWTPSWRMELEREPVYRRLFWPAGDRMTYRTMLLDGTTDARTALRLCYAQDGVKHVAGEATAGHGLDPSGTSGEVHGYVPRSASGYWTEETDENRENGEVHSLNAWGDTAGFWRD